MQLKRCKRCGSDQELSQFYRDKRATDGLFSSCKACTLAQQKTHNKKPRTLTEARREYMYEYMKGYRANNRDSVNATSRRYMSRNKDYYRLKNAERRARKLGATPPWLTDDHRAEMQDMYWLAKDLAAVSGEVYEVDHIVPLAGRDICGLHVPWNLQILPRDMNRSKSNAS